MKRYRADMHIHTCLSPCSDWEMGPERIIKKCFDTGIDIIAVCDHNSVENAKAVIQAGIKTGTIVFPGMEICSKEEVHILAIFDDIKQALDMQNFVYAHLPGKNNPELFGYQVIANERDEVIGENPRLLIGATTLSIYDIVNRTRSLNGLCIASHVDRPAFGLLSQLGFFPMDLMIDGVEVSYRVPLSTAKERIPEIGKLPCITSSDAHVLNDIGKVQTVLFLTSATLAEIRLALNEKDGRYVEV